MKVALCSVFALQFLSLPVAAEQLIAQGLKSQFSAKNKIEDACLGALTGKDPGKVALYHLVFQDYRCVLYGDGLVFRVTKPLSGDYEFRQMTHVGYNDWGDVYESSLVKVGQDAFYTTNNPVTGVSMYIELYEIPGWKPGQSLAGKDEMIRYSCKSGYDKKCVGEITTRKMKRHYSF